MSFRSSRSPVALLTAFACAVLVAGCGEQPGATAGGSAGKSGGKSGKGGKGAGGAAPVLVAKVERQKVPLMIDGIGAVEPIRTTAIRAQVAGTLLRIAIQEGQDVKEGDLLFEIDPRPFQHALQTAAADLAKLKVQLENARAQVTRYRALNTDQMVSKEQYDKIADAARALDAEVLSGESKVANAKLQLGYCSIRAPLAGRTGNIAVHEGDLIRGNDAGALVTINQLSPIYVTFGVPQQYLAALNRYRAERALPVQVVPPGIDEKPEHGELTFLDNTVDSATGTIRLKATFANAGHRLWPGQFATVSVLLSEPEVLTVANSAVQTSQTGQHVFVVSADNVAELRPVTIERSHDRVAVVAKGLKEGETVVIDGQLRVVPGRSVEIKQPVTPGAVSNAPAGGKRSGKSSEADKSKT